MSSGGIGTVNAARTLRSAPMAPSATNARANRVWGCQRYISASTHSRSAAAAASKLAATSASLTASGFSHSTCLPARSARTVHSECWVTGKAM